MDPDPGQGNHLYYSYDSKNGSVEDYVKAALPSRKLVDAIHTYQIPDPQGSKISVRHLDPIVREVIRQILEYVVKQHIKGCCLQNFELDDLYMLGNDVHFSNVGVRNSKEIEDVLSDFKCVRRIIVTLVGTSNTSDSYPPSLTDLLRLLNMKRDDFVKQFPYPQAELRLSLHLAIMPPEDVLAFIKKAGDGLPSGESLCAEVLAFIKAGDGLQSDESVWAESDESVWAERRDALVLMNDELKRMGVLPTLKDWSKRFDKAGLTYVKSCKEKTTKQDNNDEQIVESILRCCRNLAVHLREHLLSGDKSTEVLEIIIMHLMHRELIMFHSKVNETCWFYGTSPSFRLWFV